MAILNNLVHHPRKLFVRRVVFQIHLWLGILLSLYLVLISLSGALMVYHDALTRSTLPVGLSPYEPSRTAAVPAVVTAAEAAFPGASVTYLHMPSPRMPVFQLQLSAADRKPIQAVADAQTGRVVRLPRSWVDIVYEFHIELLLGESHGMQWNGVGAAGLLILAVTGMLLWWRGVKTWWHALGISFRHKWRRINYDLHHAIGVWTLLIVSVWALSAIYFAWDKPFATAVGALSPLVGMQAPTPRKVLPTGKPATLQAMLEEAAKASPQGRLTYVFNPSLAPGADVYIYRNLRTPEDFGHADSIRFDSKTGTLLSIWHYGENHTAGDWFLWSMQPLHFGSLWGPWVQALWCALGVSLAVLTVTGLLMYWNRYLRVRWKNIVG